MHFILGGKKVDEAADYVERRKKINEFALYSYFDG